MSDNCNKCGAVIEFSPNEQSLVCPFCGATNEITREEDIVPTDIDVDLVIPFSISTDDLEKRVYGLMASGNYTPDDMLDSAKFLKREQMYVPAYSFKVEYDAQWTATFGYDRTEHYTEYITKTENGHSRQVPVTRTKTVTDWRPVNGTDAGIFNMFSYGGNLLTQSPLQPSSLVDHGFGVGKPTSFNDSFTRGIQVEPFSISESNAFESEKDQLNAHIDSRVKNHAQGDRQRDWHWNATHNHSTNTVLVPVCHAVFDYEGQEYHVWTDGVDSSGIIADKLPEDKNRKRHVQMGFIPVIVGLISGVVADSSFGLPLVDVGMAFIGAALVYGFLRRYFILNYSKKIRSSLLTQMQASSTNTADLSPEDREKFSKAFQRPDKPILAKTTHDKFVIPAVTLLTLLGAILPGYLASQSQGVNNPVEEIQAAPEPAPVQAAPEPAPVQAAPEPAPVQAAPEPAPVQAAPEPAPVNNQQSRRNEFNKNFNEASQCFSAGNYDCALQKLNSAQQIDPSNQSVRSAIAKVQVTQKLITCANNNNVDCVESSANDLLRMDPNNKGARDMLNKVATIRKSQSNQNTQPAASDVTEAVDANNNGYKASFRAGPLNIQVAKRRYPTEEMKNRALEQWKREGTILEPDGSTTKFSQPEKNTNCAIPGTSC